MKAYLVTTGSVFGLIVLAHLARILDEGAHLLTDPSVGAPDRGFGGPLRLGVAPFVDILPLLTVGLPGLEGPSRHGEGASDAGRCAEVPA